MSIFNSGKLSKRELLELTIAQKKEIERLEKEVQSLTEKVSKKDRQINERLDLAMVTNTLIKLTQIIDKRLNTSGGKEHG